VLSDRGLCDELITHPEDSYRLWCVVVCDLENLKNEEAMNRFGPQRHKKKITWKANAYKDLKKKKFKRKRHLGHPRVNGNADHLMAVF